MVKWLETVNKNKIKTLQHAHTNKHTLRDRRERLRNTYCVGYFPLFCSVLWFFSSFFLHVLFTMDRLPSRFECLIWAGRWWCDAEHVYEYPRTTIHQRYCFKKQSAFYGSNIRELFCVPMYLCQKIAIKRRHNNNKKWTNDEIKSIVSYIVEQNFSL